METSTRQDLRVKTIAILPKNEISLLLHNRMENTYYLPLLTHKFILLYTIQKKIVACICGKISLLKILELVSKNDPQN